MSMVLERTDALRVAREVLQIEMDAIQRVAESLDSRFEQAVQVLLACAGRVVLSGVGKSGAIARKLAGTFSSTGTPAIFVHPTEAAHGDLGTITEQDVAILLSFRGESDELVLLCPALKRFGRLHDCFHGARRFHAGQDGGLGAGDSD
jgi:arabinose-5-phosphate isomerase